MKFLSFLRNGFNAYKQFHSKGSGAMVTTMLTRPSMPRFCQQSAPEKDAASFKIIWISVQVPSLSLIAGVNQFLLNDRCEVISLSHVQAEKLQFFFCNDLPVVQER
jgi:hypothetical protein